MERTGQNEGRSRERPSKKRLYATGLVVILGSEFILRDVFLPEHAGDIHIGIAILLEWLSILLAFWIPKIEGNELGSIGFGKFKWKYPWMGVLIYLLLLIAWIGSGFALRLIGLEGLPSLLLMIKGHSLLTRFGLLLTGALLEEIFYRGYLIERLISLTGRSWLSGLISWIAFTFVHLKFFGLGPTLDVGILSAGLVVLYLVERSVWPCIILHGVNGAFSFLIIPLLV